ncbi:MAG: spore coat protein [Clostridiales bacterium]
MAQRSQKELMYLEDVLSMEAEEIAKFTKAANTATDPQIKSMLDSISNMHQTHFNTMKQYVESNS